MSGLLFQRLARNFIKNGYFPTDEATLERVLNALDVGGSECRVLDPCCGEGVALAEVKRHLTLAGAKINAYGIEYDRERAWHAKTMLDVVAHADVQDVYGTARSMGLLFLNPPYGDVVSDKAGIGDNAKRDRLEKMFVRKTMSYLQVGGVMVLIVPHYVLDGDFTTLLSRSFTRILAFRSPEQKFKQVVIFGVKRKSETPEPASVKQLLAAFEGLAPVLPESWSDEPYVVPIVVNGEPISFQTVRIDGAQLEHELAKFRTSSLWPQFGMHFRSAPLAARKPLRDLSKWHLALALAAGQIAASCRVMMVASYSSKAIPSRVKI